MIMPDPIQDEEKQSDELGYKVERWQWLLILLGIVVLIFAVKACNYAGHP